MKITKIMKIMQIKLKVHLGIGKNYDKFQSENGIKSPYEKCEMKI